MPKQGQVRHPLQRGCWQAVALCWDGLGWPAMLCQWCYHGPYQVVAGRVGAWRRMDQGTMCLEPVRRRAPELGMVKEKRGMVPTPVELVSMLAGSCSSRAVPRANHFTALLTHADVWFRRCHFSLSSMGSPAARPPLCLHCRGCCRPGGWGVVATRCVLCYGWCVAKS
jgi:hypothetical protein